MPADALGGERNGRERILDLVGHALRHFFPGQLALRAQQFRGVFDDQHGSRLPVCEFKPSAGHGQMHGAATRVQLDFSGGRAHALSAPDHAGQIFGAVGGQQRLDAFSRQGSVLFAAP